MAKVNEHYRKLPAGYLFPEIGRRVRSFQQAHPEARVIRLYFGLDGNQPLTLEEIASVFGLSRERVRQIKERALGRLRRVRRARRLQPYFL